MFKTDSSRAWRVLPIVVLACACESTKREVIITQLESGAHVRTETHTHGSKRPVVQSNDELVPSGLPDPELPARALVVRSPLGAVSFYGESFASADDPVETVRRLQLGAALVTDVLLSFGRQELGAEPWWPELAEALDEDFRHWLEGSWLSAWGRATHGDPRSALEQVFLLGADFATRFELSSEQAVALFVRCEYAEPESLAPFVELFQQRLEQQTGARSAALEAFADPQRLTSAWARWMQSAESDALRVRAVELTGDAFEQPADWLESLVEHQPWVAIEFFGTDSTKLVYTPRGALGLVSRDARIEGGSATLERLTSGDGPRTAFIAASSEPDVDWQTAAFGSVRVEAIRLWEWCLVWSALSPATRARFEQGLATLHAGPTLPGRARELCAQLEHDSPVAERKFVAELCSKLRGACDAD